jgi:hypothetical protein
MIYSWQEPYISVLLEPDEAKFYARTLEVRAAFEQRLLSTVDDEELRAMGVAALALEALEQKRRAVKGRAQRISSIRRGNPSAPDVDI